MSFIKSDFDYFGVISKRMPMVSYVYWLCRDDSRLVHVSCVAMQGASGYLGSHIVASLLDAKCDVSAIVRDPHNLREVSLSALQQNSPYNPRFSCNWGKGVTVSSLRTHRR